MKYLSVNKKAYAEICKNKVPPTKIYKTLPAAFLTGGTICGIGEVFIYFYEFLAFPKEDAFALSSCTVIFITAVLTGLNFFDDIALKAGAGTLVPITGFSNAVVSPALEFKKEGWILGVGGRMFSIAGPVIVYGLSASFIYGLIIYLFGI